MVVESGVEVDGVGDHEGASSRGFESGVVVEARSPSTPYVTLRTPCVVTVSQIGILSTYAEKFTRFTARYGN